MKKLTPERRALVEPRIVEARQALLQTETITNRIGSEWRTHMKTVWDCQALLEKELGMSMSKQWLIVQNQAQLDDFFEPDGTPIKSKR